MEPLVGVPAALLGAVEQERAITGGLVDWFWTPILPFYVSECYEKLGHNFSGVGRPSSE